MTKKKRSADDLFKLYRSFVKQYPISKFVVATKCVEYLHQFELAQHYYNTELRFKFKFLKEKLAVLTIEEKLIGLIKIGIEELEFEFNFKEFQIRLKQVFINLKKVQIEIDDISIEGKVCQLDFSRFISTDSILGNTFEIGLVTDERKKGDVVGRKGILAADLTRQEAQDEDEVIAY